MTAIQAMRRVAAKPWFMPLVYGAMAVQVGILGLAYRLGWV